MRKHDVEELFELIGVGATVELHGERPVEVARVLTAIALVA
jgi:hypothetical protein